MVNEIEDEDEDAGDEVVNHEKADQDHQYRRFPLHQAHPMKP